jgi:hypothetical protein
LWAFAFKVEEKVLLRAKIFFVVNIQYEYPKTRNFTLISNPLNFFFEKCTKKVISKNMMEYALFSLLLMFVKLELLITLIPFKKTFSEDLKSA